MEIKLDLEERTLGDWKVEKFQIPRGASNFETERNRARGIPPGTYYRLLRGTTTVMSNTPAEIRDCYKFIFTASGRILINGLGLGVVLQALLEKENVEYIRVIEISPEVIELVGKYYLNKYPGKLEIIQADAFEYSPAKNEKFDYVWHDIWDNICSDNLEEMAKLHRKYGKKTKWQASWCKKLCQYYRRRDNGY